MTGVGDDREGRLSLRRRNGTLTPFIHLSPRIGIRGGFRAFKGEGEEETEGSACALAQALPSSLVLAGGEGISLIPAHSFRVREAVPLTLPEVGWG